MRFELNDIEKKKFVSLFEQHEKNIDYMLYLRDTVWENNNINASIFKDKNNFEKRSLFIDELFKNKPCDSEFVKKAIRWDTNLIDINEYLHNPYIKVLNNLFFKEDGWELKQKTLKAYSLFPYEEEYHFGANSILKMSLGFFDQDYTYPTISLFDREWMSLNPFEIRTMQIPLQIAKGKVLTLGLGLGYFAFMADIKEDVKEVHIVEMDLELIKLFNKYLLPLFPHPEKIHIHKAEAIDFVSHLKDREYDFIFSDLWHDVSDGLPLYIKLKHHLDKFTFTKRMYWIEGSIVTFFRSLLIGLMSNEYYQNNNDIDSLQIILKNELENHVFTNSCDLDSLLSIKGLNNLILSNNFLYI